MHHAVKEHSTLQHYAALGGPVYHRPNLQGVALSHAMSSLLHHLQTRGRKLQITARSRACMLPLSVPWRRALNLKLFIPVVNCLSVMM